MKDPYVVVKSRHVTEKSTVLQNLQDSENNRCLKKCLSPKYVFIVDREASKRDIAYAVEAIYKEKKVKVIKVNTLRTKRKTKKKGRGKPGQTASYKKAIVTMESGDTID